MNVKFYCPHCGQKISAEEHLLNSSLKCPNCQGSKIVPPAYLTDIGEHKPITKNLWQRWISWSGSFLIVSILIHLILIGGATVLVVQVMHGQKEKIKFTASPPAPPAEHRVKPTKKKSEGAPTVTRRITSTAMNVNIVLPPIDVTSSSTDLMAGVMNGIGSTGLGSGAGGVGAGSGLASMPVTGLTAFGFKGGIGNGGLVGNFYDLKQTFDQKPTGIVGFDGDREHAGEQSKANDVPQLKILNDFFDAGWDDKILDAYYKAKETMVTYQIFIPKINSVEGPKAFGVEREVPVGARWVVHYKGTVNAPKDGTFRFVGWADDLMAVRFNGQMVFIGGGCGYMGDAALKKKYILDNNPKGTLDNVGKMLSVGKWFPVSIGMIYSIEVLVSEFPGGTSGFCLMMEEQNPSVPYPKSDDPTQPLAYPIFSLKEGIPPPKYESDRMPAFTTNPIVFPGR